MITEQQLKADCTPELIKKMVELADGFEFVSDDNNIHVVRLHLAKYEHEDWILRLPLCHKVLFPLLIHRAVEGWNKQNDGKISVHGKYIEYQKDRKQVLQSYMEMSYEFDEYKPQSLTHAECAMLHCLMEVLK